MAGFILKNTLSENGAVTRGICETNEEGYLTAVHETSNIVKTPEGAAVDNDGQLTSINAESYACEVLKPSEHDRATKKKTLKSKKKKYL